MTGRSCTADSSYDVGARENATLAAGDGAQQVRRLKEASALI
jgi:hypothetical protein